MCGTIDTKDFYGPLNKQCVVPLIQKCEPTNCEKDVNPLTVDVRLGATTCTPCQLQLQMWVHSSSYAAGQSVCMLINIAIIHQWFSG